MRQEREREGWGGDYKNDDERIGYRLFRLWCEFRDKYDKNRIFKKIKVKL